MLAVLTLTALTAAAPPTSVECTNSDTGAKATVSISRVKDSVKRVQKTYEQYSIAVLDLSKEVQERRQRLPEDLKTGDWCVVANHVRVMEDALAVLSLDEAFVTEKFSRVERWVRSGLHSPAASKAAQKQIEGATGDISRASWTSANKKLTQAIVTLFELKSPWDVPRLLPTELAASDGSRPPLELDADEVNQGCPNLAKKGKVKGADLTDTLAKLGKLMSERKVRAEDVKGGGEFLEDLRSYKRLQATWPATRVACALLHRVQGAEIDLGLVMGRFNRIQDLRDKRPLTPEQEPRFKELVRKATDAVAVQGYTEAHGELEELLVLLGEPANPAASLE